MDSISRPHFYRTMRKATEALKKISEDSTIKTMFLDFELVQSIGQQTFENLISFFCGVLESALTNLFSFVVNSFIIVQCIQMFSGLPLATSKKDLEMGSNAW